jgi:sterol desaturase/sphingolipid hydroxylase (fatty acid hydroxylase superfamily)
LEGVPVVVAGLLAILVAAEIAWSCLRGRRAYNLWESLSNLRIAAVNNVLKPVALTWHFFVMSLIEPLQVFQLPDTVWAFVMTFVVADLAYYWYHRLSHELPLLWAMHHTHHSSPWMNLTTAVRLNWIAKFVSPVFFAPLVLLGLSPLYLGASLALGLFFQLFLHTRAIGRLGWFEGKLLNTPSAHRVHHGSNTQYIVKNYAGVFIVWDRLFGTYEPEQEQVKYGVTTGFVGHNPFVVQFEPLRKYVRGEWQREARIAPEFPASVDAGSGHSEPLACQ